MLNVVMQIVDHAHCYLFIVMVGKLKQNVIRLIVIMMSCTINLKEGGAQVLAG
jgi:hypothetical protein